MEEKKDTQIENAGRRKAVKTIVGGVTALAAYNVLPVKWGTPIIEQVFLPAHAATSGAVGYTYVGSWAVADGPAWGSGPPTYTGQEAAALLFGGSAADYAISTVSNQVADINNSAWIDSYAGPSSVVAEDYKVDTGAAGYTTTGDTSTYVSDHGVTSINYAFRKL